MLENWLMCLHVVKNFREVLLARKMPSASAFEVKETHVFKVAVCASTLINVPKCKGIDQKIPVKTNVTKSRRLSEMAAVVLQKRASPLSQVL